MCGEGWGWVCSRSERRCSVLPPLSAKGGGPPPSPSSISPSRPCPPPLASCGSASPSPFALFTKTRSDISFLAMDSAGVTLQVGGEVRGMGKRVTGGEMPPSSNKAGS